MKKHLAALGTIFLGIPNVFAQQSIVTFTSINGGDTFNNGGSYTLGFEFDVTSPITVTGLSVFDQFPAYGSPVSTPVALWNSSQTETASVTVPAGTACPVTSDGFFRYASLSTPITLSDGIYYVGDLSTARSANYTFGVNGLSAIPGVTFVGSAASSGTGLGFPSYVGPGTNGTFGGNVVVAETSVPEPQPWVLLSVGLTALSLWNFRRVPARLTPQPKVTKVSRRAEEGAEVKQTPSETRCEPDWWRNELRNSLGAIDEPEDSGEVPILIQIIFLCDLIRSARDSIGNVTTTQ